MAIQQNYPPIPHGTGDSVDGYRAAVLQTQVTFEVGGLKAIPNGGQEPASGRAINDLVIVGQRQGHHLAYGDGIGVSLRAPSEPMLVMVNVPPLRSAGFNLLLRARSAMSVMA